MIIAKLTFILEKKKKVEFFRASASQSSQLWHRVSSDVSSLNIHVAFLQFAFIYIPPSSSSCRVHTLVRCTLARFVVTSISRMPLVSVSAAAKSPGNDLAVMDDSSAALFLRAYPPGPLSVDLSCRSADMTVSSRECRAD